MKKLLLFLCLSFWILISCQKQAPDQELCNYKLFVTLENAPFDSLFLFDYTNKRDIFIAGKKIDKSTWEITIPDSIVWDSDRMHLRSSKYDFVSNSIKGVRFFTERDGKKIIVANIGVEDRKNYIYAKYIEQNVFPDEYMRIAGTDSIIIGNVVDEDFRLILQDDSSDIIIRAQEPYFSWFINLNNEEISYDEYLARYVELSKKYPDSRFLICNLSCMLNRYKSKEDVKKVYDNLSNKHKNTIWAKQIERFLSAKFENTSLPSLDQNNFEKIVQDSSKYNLVVFTASWCRPCIKEIPLLKKIHEDLNKNLIMTYISIDEKETIEAFQKQMREKKILWRALLAFQDIDGIKKKYFIDGIPQGILVDPDGNMDMIDVRNDEQRDKLYSLCDK